MDDCADLMPGWLCWVKGVVDFAARPLASSSESQQLDQFLPVIKQFLVERCLEMSA